MGDQQPFEIANEVGLPTDDDYYFPSEDGLSVGSALSVGLTLTVKSARFMIETSSDRADGWVGVVVAVDSLGIVIPTSGWIAVSGESSFSIRTIQVTLPFFRLRVQRLTSDNAVVAYAKRSYS